MYYKWTKLQKETISLFYKTDGGIIYTTVLNNVANQRVTTFYIFARTVRTLSNLPY